MTRIACAHSVMPFLQTSQMSGTAVSGHGFVSGPASTQSVSHSKKPLAVHVHCAPQAGPDVAHPVPGAQAAPCVQSGGGGDMHPVAH
jgi:hypothetical protein